MQHRFSGRDGEGSIFVMYVGPQKGSKGRTIFAEKGLQEVRWDYINNKGIGRMGEGKTLAIQV